MPKAADAPPDARRALSSVGPGAPDPPRAGAARRAGRGARPAGAGPGAAPRGGGQFPAEPLHEFLEPERYRLQVGVRGCGDGQVGARPGGDQEHVPVVELGHGLPPRCLRIAAELGGAPGKGLQAGHRGGVPFGVVAADPLRVGQQQAVGGQQNGVLRLGALQSAVEHPAKPVGVTVVHAAGSFEVRVR